MKRLPLRCIQAILCVIATCGVIEAQQSIPVGQRAAARAGRGQTAIDRPLADQPQPAKPQPNQPAKPANDDLPKLTPQQANTARLIENRYLLNVQSQVGLTPAQGDKVAISLQKFLRRSFQLSVQRAELNEQAQKLIKQKVSDEEYDRLNQELTKNERRRRNVEDTFYKEVLPDLSPELQLRLRRFMQEMSIQVHQAIQDSRQQN